MDSQEWDTVAPKYFDQISSPFSDGVKNPLLKDLARIKKADEKSIIDIGCGIGNLLPYSKRFKRIVCLDFSQGMIDQAKKKHPEIKAEYICSDAKHTPLHKAEFDVAVAINSFIAPDLGSLQGFFDEAGRVIKPKGQFFGIFPAIESVLHLFTLVFERELRIHNDEKKAYENAAKAVDLDSYDLPTGLLWEDGFQHHYYQHTIERRLRKAGFEQIQFGKISYPWRLSIIENVRPYLREEPPWDWYVKAVKTR